MSDAIFASAPRLQERAFTPRVLIVGSALSGGGAENHFRLLFENLFRGKADAAALLESPTRDLSPGQCLHMLGWRGKLDYVKAAVRLRRLIASRRYDAVLSVGLYPNVVLWAATRGIADRPALIMIEITQPYTESMRFSGAFAARVRQPLYRLSYRGADLVAANSEDGLREVVEHYSAEIERARRVPNLVDVSRVRALASAAATTVRAAQDHTASRFCMVTRFDPIKRIDTLLRAASALGPEMCWQIDLVGDGVARVSIETLIAELGLQKRVTLHGWMANPYPIMAAATATILCSEYEGFSNTLLESMVVGTPVVTSFCSLDARLMVEEGAALGFEVGDWAALSGHLAALSRGPELATHLRSKADRYAVRHYTDAAIADYETIIRDAIAYRLQPCHD